MLEAGGSTTGSRPDVPPELLADATTDPLTVTSRRWVQSVVRTGIAELPEHEHVVLDTSGSPAQSLARLRSAAVV